MWKLSLIAILLFSNAQTMAAEVVSVFPTGSVKQVQQIIVKFSTDMVALGDPRTQKAPLQIHCVSGGKKANPKFTTRWADTKTWSIDFERPLSSGVNCSLTKNSAKDLKGIAVSSSDKYSFLTGGPALLGASPQYGDIEPEQYFIILTDGEINIDSLQKVAYFEIESIPDKVGLVVVKDEKQRDEVLRADIKESWRWHEFRKYLKSKKPLSQIHELDNFILMRALRRFPDNHDVTLHWPNGILSKSGVAVTEAQSLKFHVMRSFEATFSCERSAPERPCNPVLGMRLNFSNRIPTYLLKGAKLVSEKGTDWTPVELQSGDQNKNSNVSAGTSKSHRHFQVIENFSDQQVDKLTFAGPFPEKTKFKLTLPPNIRDEIGRALVNQDKFPLETSTDVFSPLIKFSAAFGLLELKADPILPVSLRNVEKQIASVQKTIDGKTLALTSATSAKEVVQWYHKLLEKSNDYEHRGIALMAPSDGQKVVIPKPMSEKDFELVGIPFRKPGFYVVELESPKLGLALLGGGTMYVASGALVTNLSVHFKKGRESSLVWVTSLDSGKPVKSAEVSIYNGDATESLFHGKTDSDGILRVGNIKFACGFKLADSPNESWQNNSSRNCETFVFAKKDDDFSFVSDRWSQGIEDYRFNMSREYLAPQWGPVIAHTVFSRSLMQAGETVNMKHILREHAEEGFRKLNALVLPKRVLIVHQGSQKTFTLPFQWNEASGTAINEFKVPADAPLGTYSVYLSNKKELPAKETRENDPFDWTSKPTGSFTVSEYRLPLMQASVKIQGEKLIRPKEVKVDLSASYMSGGPAAGLDVKVRSLITPGYFSPDVPGGGDYSFFADPVVAGLKDTEAQTERDEQKMLKVQNLKLKPDGGILAVINQIPIVKKIGKLSIEMEYHDPNGEVKTASAEKDLFPSEFIVGLRSDTWIASPGKISVQGVITDTSGKAAASVHFTVEAFQSNYITHRKKLVGGFYSYDSKTETVALGQVCEGKSDSLGRFSCDAKKMPAGSVILQAKVNDDKGHSTFASVSMSVFESGEDSWWAPTDSDRIDFIPERNRYEPGETAKMVLRSPFPKSTVLVTIEREGVLDGFVREIKRDQSTVEIPLKGNYAPNVFVSALAIRGRAGDVQPTALIDLGKPALKLGMTELKVGWKAHELKVVLKGDKPKYKTRDVAKIHIQVKLASGEKLPAGAEVAFAALDDSLLQLKPNHSWNILEAMMGQRGLEVDSSSSQNQVIGKRHFGAKAKPPGGGGGSMAGDTRELFDAMLLWNPSVKLDANGEADVKVPLNDSITTFHIEAIAQVGMDLFGNGSLRIQSTKDLILYSGFAPLVRDGDFIHNGLTVRNTTTSAMEISLKVTSPQISNLPDLEVVKLAPSEAKTVEINLKVPLVLKDIDFVIQAKDKLSSATDGMKFSVKTQPAVPARVMQATLIQVDKALKVPVRQPKEALPNVGGLSVDASETLVAGLAGVKSYMEDYPYSCLEQQVSKAITAENRKKTEELIQALPSYLDSQGLLKFFPVSLCGSPQLTRYVSKILLANNYSIPEETRSRLIAGMQSYVNGNYSCHTWWDSIVRDIYQDQKRVLLLESLSELKSFKPADLSSIKITPNLWANETLAAWFHLLKREPAILGREVYLKQAESILRSRVNYQGSLMNLQGGVDWEGQWQLFSSNDQDAIDVFAVSIEEQSWESDAGKMARGIVARLHQGVWDSTMANAWGVTNLRKFSAKFEKDKVMGTTHLTAPKEYMNFDWAKNPHGEKKNGPWPDGTDKAAIDVNISHSGTGKPWLLIQTLSAIPLKAPLDLGYKINRKVTPIVQKKPGTWSMGDVANIEIVIQAKADQAWVVVRDPIPAGASHLGNGLEGGSAILDHGPKKSKNNEPSSWPTEFEEKSQAYFISYAAYLPRGTYSTSYRVRLNSVGEFRMPPSRVEAMYAPETFGEAPIANWIVAP